MPRKKQKPCFTIAESRVLSFLGVGEENAVSRAKLSQLTGYTDRYNRYNISSLRRKGIEIMTNTRSTGGGYWISSGREDKEAFVEHMESRGRHCLGVIKPIRKELKTAKNQDSFFDREEQT